MNNKQKDDSIDVWSLDMIINGKETIKDNWAGGTTQASLSEVRFLYILDDAAAKP